MFLARVSRGRTIKQIAMGVLLICPLALMLFYSFLGGSAVYAEMANPGVISGTYDVLGYPGVLWATLGTLPFTNILAVGFIILISLFLVTTCDSMSLTCAIAVSGHENPHVFLRLFWGLTFGVTAAVLMFMGGLQALQSAIIVTCIPITFICILVMYTTLASLREADDYVLPGSVKASDSVVKA
jgi:choline-glycine betaine transporter